MGISHPFPAQALSRDADGVECPLYVCRDSTLVLERGGFAKYKRDLDKAARDREAKATADARRRAAQRAAGRREKLRKHADKRPPPPP